MWLRIAWHVLGTQSFKNYYRTYIIILQQSNGLTACLYWERRDPPPVLPWASVLRIKRLSRWTRDLRHLPNATSKWVMQMRGNDPQRQAHGFAVGQRLEKVKVAGKPDCQIPHWRIRADCGFLFPTDWHHASPLQHHMLRRVCAGVYRWYLIWQQVSQRRVLLVWGSWALVQRAPIILTFINS